MALPSLIKKVATRSQTSDNQISSSSHRAARKTTQNKKKVLLLCVQVGHYAALLHRQTGFAPLIVLDANVIQSDTILSENQYREAQKQVTAELELLGNVIVGLD